MSTILVFVEQNSGSCRRAALECLGAAAALGGDVVAVLTGPGATDAAAQAQGAGRAIVLSGAEPYSPDATASCLAAIAGDLGAQVFLCAATATGNDLAPRVAAHLDSVLFSDCTDLAAEGDSYQATRPWLAGKAIAHCTSSGPVFCATTRVNCFSPCETAGASEISERAASTDGKARVTSLAPKEGTALDVSEAPVVISGGRGMKDPESFAILEELAKAFGEAAVGASRAVVDAGWRPHGDQVGQTGKVVSPELYIAVGISGAIQHVAGMKTSGTIVAINKDADAPIFKLADFGIVGDAFEVIPALTAAVSALKAQG
ncbi:MAG: electron transfer flavoprotein subunit alpha/FixB family protein [bacterium]|jgi:electron transfer flavoprotein alpha subunit|nr:electron transfer flavoprotein subunit alpha/FixB family protein [Planctomycetota bacterium]HIL52712.1 electron transfer flavoprotein subunit alpha/FixB family protein [Planctomycetota bacterium]